MWVDWQWFVCILLGPGKNIISVFHSENLGFNLDCNHCMICWFVVCLLLWTSASLWCNLFEFKEFWWKQGHRKSAPGNRTNRSWCPHAMPNTYLSTHTPTQPPSQPSSWSCQTMRSKTGTRLTTSRSAWRYSSTTARFWYTIAMSSPRATWTPSTTWGISRRWKCQDLHQDFLKWWVACYTRVSQYLQDYHL